MIITSEDDLRKPSKEISLEEGLKIVTQLIDELEKSEVGVGLSAPQIGIWSRAVVMKTDKGIKAFINPKIVEKQEPFVNKKEGCLSFPGLWLNTIRFHSVIVEDDLHGRTEIKNFAAVIMQHETDHLDGILFLDRKVPENYDPCFCGSEKKFKFCCREKIR